MASKQNIPLTDLLRRCLSDSDSMRRVSIDTGVERMSLVRFRDGKQSLRLDMADRLCAYYGIEFRKAR